MLDLVLFFLGACLGAVLNHLWAHYMRRPSGYDWDREPDWGSAEFDTPEWDDDTLAVLRDDGPGETTGPFLITDLGGPVVGPTEPKRAFSRAAQHHYHERLASLADEETAARWLLLDQEFAAWEAAMGVEVAAGWAAVDGFDQIVIPVLA